MANPETLDRIASNTLALRLKDERFAKEVYADLLNQAILASERWLDASLEIDLSPLASAPGYFAVTARWEYSTVPQHAQRQFVCLSDREEYAELAQARSATSAWFFLPDALFSATQREAFELMQFSVNGEDRTIRRSSRKDYQAYSVAIGDEHVQAGELVTVAYTLRTVTRMGGHLLFFEVEQPTRDLRVSFDYTGCGIARVSALDLVPSVRPTRIEHTPDGVAPRGVRVEIDGWTFPRSGVAFVWTLDSENALYPPAGWLLFGVFARSVGEWWGGVPCFGHATPRTLALVG